MCVCVCVCVCVWYVYVVCMCCVCGVCGMCVMYVCVVYITSSLYTHPWRDTCAASKSWLFLSSMTVKIGAYISF